MESNTTSTFWNVNEEIMKMYNSSVYQELKDYYSKTTIFNVLKIERNENRHSAFLCWLFNSSASHDLGEVPMKKLLRLYASKMEDGLNDNLKILLMAGNYDLRISEIQTEKAVKKTSKKDASGRIDIWARMTLTNKEEENEVPLVLIIENKIYSGEGDNQTQDYHDYFKKTKEYNETAIEIFLTPDAQAPTCPAFINIIYPELLKHVILPLSKMAMPTEAGQLISDYIRNLSKPSIDIDKGGYTVIATSEDEKEKLKKIYSDYKPLYQAALIAGNMVQVLKYGNKEYFNQLVTFLGGLQLISTEGNKLTVQQAKKYIQEMNHLQLLEAFWNNNEDLFKAILPQIDKELEIPIDGKQIFKVSHRDTSRYDVFIKDAHGDKKSYGKRLFKNRAANAIFRAYIDKNPHISLEELRQRFPGYINCYYYNKAFQHLFYKADTVNPPFDMGKAIGQIGDINWDFLYKDEFLLPIANGNQKVMSVKVWRKPDFDRLLQYLKEENELQFIQVNPCDE